MINHIPEPTLSSNENNSVNDIELNPANQYPLGSTDESSPQTVQFQQGEVSTVVSRPTSAPRGSASKSSLKSHRGHPPSSSHRSTSEAGAVHVPVNHSVSARAMTPSSTLMSLADGDIDDSTNTLSQVSNVKVVIRKSSPPVERVRALTFKTRPRDAILPVQRAPPATEVDILTNSTTAGTIQSSAQLNLMRSLELLNASDISTASTENPDIAVLPQLVPVIARPRSILVGQNRIPSATMGSLITVGVTDAAPVSPSVSSYRSSGGGLSTRLSQLGHASYRVLFVKLDFV